MVNYKLINEKTNYFVSDTLEVVCKNRGVSDVDFIKNPTDKYNGHYSQLVNMDKAVKVFKAFIDTGEVLDVATIVDADNDGFVSSSILTQYLEKNFPNVRMHFLFHPGKQHGITPNIMEQLNEMENLDILFVPDAGSSDIKQHKELYEKGVPVIVLDHHQTSELSEYAVVVNNQTSPEYKNKQLSGVGIVYRFLQSLDTEFNLNDAENHLDEVAWGQISDSMDLANSPETRYLTYEGFKNLQNPFLKQLIFEHIGKWERVYPQTMAFNLIPKINATIRVGEYEDKRKVFYAMIGRDEEFYNTRTKKTENLIETASRISKNLHAKQNRTKKKWLGSIKEKIAEQNLNARPILVLTFSKKEKFDNALGGVIASSLTNIYRKPVIMLTYNEEKNRYGGSIRGYEEFTPDLKSFLEELNVFDWIQGHANAAGCQITADNLKIFNQLQDKMIKQFALEGNSVQDNPIMVDFIISAKNMRGQIVDEVQKCEKYWSKGLEAPVFCIQDLEVDMNDVKVSSGGMIKLEVNGVSYTQFAATQEWIDLAETNQKVTFDAIGTLGINSFMGQETRQCIMNNYVIKKAEESNKKKVLFEF